MKLIIVLILAVAASAFMYEPTPESFEVWQAINGKSSYPSLAEKDRRFAVWANNVNRVREMNAKAQIPNSGIEGEFEVNQFADMTDEEFKSDYLQCYQSKEETPELKPLDEVLREREVDTSVPPPASVDWREKGAVTGVKDQGQCGSCWAFATTGTAEGHWFIQKGGSLLSLSEQDEVDCSKKQHNIGCNGGRVDWGLQYIIAAKGIDTEAAYPYTAKDGTCKHKGGTNPVAVAKVNQVKQKNETDLMAAVAIGPVGVAIAVTNSWANYKSGVFYDQSCSPTQLSHAVLAVGYGTLDGKDYWIVKNSWGAKWGNQGYILMSRNRNNNCGIASDAYYPTI